MAFLLGNGTSVGDSLAGWHRPEAVNSQGVGSKTRPIVGRLQGTVLLNQKQPNVARGIGANDDARDGVFVPVIHMINVGMPFRSESVRHFVPPPLVCNIFATFSVPHGKHPVIQVNGWLILIQKSGLPPRALSFFVPRHIDSAPFDILRIRRRKSINHA
jgi:hypothetical protein